MQDDNEWGFVILEDGDAAAEHLGALHERGDAVADANGLLDEVRPLLPHAASAKTVDARIRYAAGTRYRVAVDYARLEGIRQWGKIRAGFSRPLERGEIIESTGFREGLAGNGFMEANFTYEGATNDFLWLQVWPMQGLFLPWPMDGVLEPIEEEE